MGSELDRLIEAVEGGSFPRNLDALNEARIFKDCGQGYTAGSAFNGSLDAAKALHEALLPGWGWDVTNGSAFVVLDLDDYAEYGDEPFVQYAAVDDNPARAWLIAVLKAYRAQQQE